jgi:tetratricopeptide (TPR) repeat protein
MPRYTHFELFKFAIIIAALGQLSQMPASLASSVSVSRQSLPPNLALLASNPVKVTPLSKKTTPTVKKVSVPAPVKSSSASLPVKAVAKKATPIAKAYMVKAAPQKSVDDGNSAGSHKLLSKANTAVKQKDYPTAIADYESALGKNPKDQHYRRNLSILYFNYGVELQEKGEYESAQKALDQSLFLSQVDSADALMVKEAKASAYYSQAMSLRGKIIDGKASGTYATADELESVRSYLKKAMQLSPGQGAYRQGMASTYLDEAFDLASQERYREAIPVLEKAKALDPLNESVPESLANVYLGVARTDTEHQQMWIDKALAADKSPNIVHTAEQIRQMSTPYPSSGSPAPSKTDKPSVQSKAVGHQWPTAAAVKAPADISRLSVRDMIASMETTLGVTPATSENLVQRLEAIETPLFGKPGTGNLTVRTKTAYTALLGQSSTKTAQAAPKEAGIPNMGEP